MDEIGLIDVDASNIDAEHICCALGDDADNVARAADKKAWLRDRFAEGHRFKKADARGKVFIEYGPAEAAWFPVEAPGWTLVQCFWVSGRFKGTGLGSRLLAACEADARSGLGVGKGSAGVLFIAGRKKLSYLSDGKFLAARGYEAVDSALGGDVELLAKRFDGAAPSPRFATKAKACRDEGGRGLTIYWSAQCPFVPAYAREMAAAAEARGVPARLVAVDSLEKAKALPSPFAMLSAFLDGELLAREPMTGDRFGRLLEERAAR